MSFQHEYPYGDVHEMNLDWLIQTMQDFINSERAAGNTPTVASVRSYFTHKYPYGDIHELNLDWVIQTALRMEEIGDSVEGDIGELQTRMTAAETNISTLDNTVGGLSDSIGQIETEIEEIQDDVSALDTTVGQHTTQIAALDQKIDTQVVANPADAATDTLSKIEIAGTVYGVEGSGGSEVEANPAGEPTDTLEKIGIDGTVYAVDGSVEPVSKTATGNPIHIEDAAAAPIVSGVVTFEPVQDLHGYDKPWAGGAGKNKLENSSISKTENGITFTVNADGTVTANGTATETVFLAIPVDTSKVNGNLLFNGAIGGSANTYNAFMWDVTTGGRCKQWNGTNNSDNGFANLTEVQIIQGNNVQYRMRVHANQTVNNVKFYPMICASSETDPAFEPYSNICPIEGHTVCEVEVTDDATSPTVTNTYAIDLNGTRYGGTVDLVSGKVTVTHKLVTLDGSENWGKSALTQCDIYMFSNSEANLSKPFFLSYYGYCPSNYNVVGYGWKGSSNVQLRIGFAEYGTTTVTDFKDYLSNNPLEFCFALATPFTVQLTPEQIRTLEGTNNISTNMASMSLKYITQDYQPLVKLIERSAGHHYSEQERVVGTWIDGKPLYEKVVDFGALPNTTTKSVAHNISDIDEIISCQGTAKRTTGDFYPIPYTSTTSSSNVAMYANNIDINIVTGFDRSNETAYVTLQYTKTTD